MFLVFRLQNPNQKPVILRKRRQRIKIESNWELFYYRYVVSHRENYIHPIVWTMCCYHLHLITLFIYHLVTLLTFFSDLLKIPGGPCTVQPHLEPEDEGGATGRSGGGDASFRRGPRAWQCHRHLLESPGV